MSVRASQQKVVFDLTVLSAFRRGPSFAHESQPLTRGGIRVEFIPGMTKVKSSYVACLQNLSLTPENVYALEKEGGITGPDILVCLEERNGARSALPKEYKTIRTTLRERSKAKLRQFVEGKRAAARDKGGKK